MTIPSAQDIDRGLGSLPGATDPAVGISAEAEVPLRKCFDLQRQKFFRALSEIQDFEDSSRRRTDPNGGISGTQNQGPKLKSTSRNKPSFNQETKNAFRSLLRSRFIRP